MKLSESKINLNYTTYVDKLREYGAYTEEMEQDDKFNELLRTASVGTHVDSGLAFAGSLVDSSVRTAIIAFNINKQLKESVRLDVESIVRVAYLYQLGSAVMLAPNDNEWEISRGKLFKYTNANVAIKRGEMSAHLCNTYGVKLTQEEYEAILAVDKVDDEQSRIFGSMLSQVLRASADLVKSEYRLNYKGENVD